MSTFSSCDAVADHIDTIIRREPRADRYARLVVGRHLRKDIQNRLGKSDLLPPPLKESTVRDRVRLGFTPNDTLLRTGGLRRSIEEGEIGPRDSGVGSDSKIAVYHEFGGKIRGRPPQRSFMASTFREKQMIYFREYVSSLRWALGL
jgi:hypothetical protein